MESARSTLNGDGSTASSNIPINDLHIGRQIHKQMRDLLFALTWVAIAKDLMGKGRQQLIAYTYRSRNSGKVELSLINSNNGLKYTSLAGSSNKQAQGRTMYLTSSNTQFKRKLVLVVDDNEKYQCPVPYCELLSDSTEDVIRHIATDIQSKQERCPLCSKTGSTIRPDLGQQAVRQHVSRHFAPTIKCPDCDRTFALDREMKAHRLGMYGHLADCMECGLILKASDLDSHKRNYRQYNEIAHWANLRGTDMPTIPRMEQRSRGNDYQTHVQFCSDSRARNERLDERSLPSTSAIEIVDLTRETDSEDNGPTGEGQDHWQYSDLEIINQYADVYQQRWMSLESAPDTSQVEHRVDLEASVYQDTWYAYARDVETDAAASPPAKRMKKGVPIVVDSDTESGKECGLTRMGLFNENI